MKNNAKKIYIVAALLSLVLYVAGVGTGYFIQGDTFGFVQTEIGDVKDEISIVEQELPLLSLRGEGSCRILNTLSLDVNDKLNSILSSLVELERQGVSGETYDELLNDYTSLAVRGWILDRDIKQNCQDDSVSALYFFSVPCDECIDQGEIIGEMRRKYGEGFSVFVLNSDTDQPAVKILTKSFNITETPSMIIDSKPFIGKMSRDTLDNLICTKLNEC